MRKNLFRNLLAFAGMLITTCAYAQIPTSNENYIQRIECLDADCVKQSTMVEYYDGLGRPKQIVNVKASPTQKDVVTHIEYDGFGRQVKDFLPVPQSNTLNGNIIPNPLANATNPNIYGNERIFAEKKLEKSPLDRLQEQTKVGNDWANKPIKYEYLTNSDNDIRGYVTTTNTVEGITNSTVKVANNNTGSQNGYYKAGILYKRKATDEDGNVTYEYTNGREQLLLTRRVLNTTENADTYYIYNEYNQLAFIIPPKASDAIKNLPTGTQISDDILNNLCYQYRLDGKDRLAEKKLPNKGWEYFVYDKQDRLVLTQDANLRTTSNNFQNKGWIFMKYDESGRVVYTGFYPNSDSRLAIQNQVNNLTTNSLNNEIRIASPTVLSGTNLYYRNLAFPSSNITLLRVNYYDTYPQEAPTVATTILDQYVLPQTLDANNDASTNELLTASYVKNIENDNWTKTFTFYDTMGNVIATRSMNHLGGYTNKDLKLGYLGKTIEKSITYHKRLKTDTEKIITETFEYDHQNRLLVQRHQVGNNPIEILAQNEYNELLQIKNKKIGGTDSANPVQSVDYTYNIQGWLTKVNNPQNLGDKLFAYELKFTNPTNTNLSSPYFNGNIAEVDWITSNGEGLKRYSYQYDAMGRLKSGIYSEPNASIPENNYYNEVLTYDLNGNVKTLKRNRNAQYIGSQLMDDLTYSYTGNRLDTVVDSSGNYFGYPDSSGSLITYDDNANMKSQADKGLLQIDYNYLNLPSYIKFDKVLATRTGRINENTYYTYRSDGIKLGKIYNFAPSNPLGTITQLSTKATEYLDGFQYEGISAKKGTPALALQFVPTEEGYYDFVQNKYFYQYKDQVGNVRLAYYKDASGNAVVDRATDFYPFGLEFGGGEPNLSASLSPNYRYGFQEQEKQEDTGWSSFKWRNYDPTYVGFFNIDPLAEKYAYQSPFNFSENAVVAHRELEGLEKQHVFYTPFGVLVYTSTAGAGAASSQSTGVYNELKRATNNSLNFWGGVAAGAGAKAKDLANRVLNSEGDSKTETEKDGSSNEKKKTTLEKNKSQGKKGENAITEELKKEFPEDEILTQVTGKFKDGKTTRFDDVILDGQTKKVKGTNETKTGNAKLTKPQKRYRDGETVELTGKRSGDAKGAKINVNTTPDRVTRQ